MATGSRHRMSQVMELVYGTTPANPKFEQIRHTTTTLGLSKDPLTSAELREDRQIATYRQGSPRVGGDIGAELSMDSYDTQLEAVLLGTWAPDEAVTGTTISFSAGGKTISDSANGFGVFAVGQLIVVKGTASNDGRFTITAATASQLTVTEAVVTEAASASVTVETYLSVLRVGTQRRSFSVERNFSDLAASAKPYHTFTGVEYSTIAATIAPNALIEMTFGVVGLNLSLAETEATGAEYAPKLTTDAIDTFTGSIHEDGARLCVVTELTFNLDNGIAPRFVVGQEDCPAPLRASISRSNCTGQVTAYFENSVLLEKFINTEASQLVFTLGDSDTEYQFMIPRIFYTGGQPDVSGEEDIIITLPFQAVFDPTLGTNLQITKQAKP